MLFAAGGASLLFKTFRSANDSVFAVSQRDRLNVHRNAMPCTMAKEHIGFARLAVTYGVGKLAGFFHRLGGVGFEVDKKLVPAKAAKHVLRHVSADLFRAMVPEGHLAIAVDQAHAHAQMIEHRFEDLR